jgi:hypothetical protein
MQFDNCFTGLTIHSTLSSKNYIFIKHANRTGSYRVFANYNTVSSKTNTFRPDYGDFLDIDLNGKEWQWHHVVERTHLTSLFSDSEVDNLYKKQIPTVLIHQRTEHIDYNLLHAHGVKTVFDLVDNKRLYGDERTACVTTLARLYTRVYGHDHVLKTVVSNILRQL